MGMGVKEGERRWLKGVVSGVCMDGWIERG